MANVKGASKLCIFLDRYLRAKSQELFPRRDSFIYIYSREDLLLIIQDEKRELHGFHRVSRHTNKTKKLDVNSSSSRRVRSLRRASATLFSFLFLFFFYQYPLLPTSGYYEVWECWDCDNLLELLWWLDVCFSWKYKQSCDTQFLKILKEKKEKWEKIERNNKSVTAVARINKLSCRLRFPFATEKCVKREW